MFFQAARQLLLDFCAVHPAKAAPSAPPVLVPLSHDAEISLHERRIASFLSMLLPDSVDVRLTDNRTSLISSSRRGGRRVVRLHRMFRTADDRLLKAVGIFLMGSATREISKSIDSFIAAHRDEIRASLRPGRCHSATAIGQTHNLDEVLRKVSVRYFGAAEGVSIGWARVGHRTRRRRRSGRITRALATYCYEDRSIRVNPVLDSPKVPASVIEWVVYHEMLHHVLPVKRSGGRARYHTAEFRALERAFHDYDTVKEWEAANLHWLLR